MMSTVINLESFKHKLRSFPRNYMRDFDNFWKQKLKSESEEESILDDKHRKETYQKLCHILTRWQTYRGGKNLSIDRSLRTLEYSLREVKNAYNKIRRCTLLDFDKIPEEPLKIIWHEFGRVKERGGERNSYGYYYIISVCKPLMLLWGQTLAFDSHVRENAPSKYHIPRRRRWSFEEWRSVMVKFQEDLKQDTEILDFFREISRNKYGTNSIIPYGRFLDIYYY